MTNSEANREAVERNGEASSWDRDLRRAFEPSPERVEALVARSFDSRSRAGGWVVAVPLLLLVALLLFETEWRRPQSAAEPADSFVRVVSVGRAVVVSGAGRYAIVQEAPPGRSSAGQPPPELESLR